MNLDTDIRTQAPRALAVRAAGVLALAGGLLAVVTALLPPPAEGSENLILVTGTVALVAGILMLWRKPDMDQLALTAFGIGGTALITIATHEGGVQGGTADNEMLYLWIVLYSFYFLSMRLAVFQLVVMAGAYAWLLSTQHVTANQASTEWLVTISTLAVAGVIVARSRGHLYRLLAELKDRARHDGLTGLLNRTALDERMDEERSRSLRDGRPISVLAVDVDGFKELNDTLGHARGDEVLRQVAAGLELWTRRHDAVARIGGDEFVLVLPGTSERGAEIVADDLRTAVSGSLRAVGLTISIGVATGHDPMPSFEELLKVADSAMYAGKRAGGDRVSRATRDAQLTAS